MNSFTFLVRRTHLYLSLFCLPWFVMYGITSFAFTHPDWFDDGRDFYTTAGANWIEAGSWSCSVPVPDEGPVPRDIATELLQVAGVEADAYGAYRSGDEEITVYIIDFWKARRLTYTLDEDRLSLYTRAKPSQHVLTGMHARAGYQHDSFLNDLWAVMVDVVMIGFILWVITGVYIWLQAPGMRFWGIVGLAAGVLSFALFLWLL